MTEVVVVIRTLNESRWLGHVLDLVIAQRGVRALPFVLDSGSADSTVDIARAKGARIDSLPGRYAPGYALNWAMQHAESEFVAFLSGHAPPAAGDWLASLLAPLRDPAVAASFGRQLPHADCDPWEAELVRNAYPGPGRAPTVKFSNANSAVRRSCWQSIAFDDKVSSSEDAIWAAAVESAGWRVRYAPDAAVYHSHNDNFRVRYRRIRRQAAAMARAFPHEFDVRVPLLRGIASAGAGIAADLMRAARGQLPVRVAVSGVPFRLASSLGRAAGIREARRAGVR